MAALWLAQVLCPERHAICALAYDSEQTPAADVEAQLQLVMASGALGERRCGLCGSRDLSIQHGKLFTDDWEEATAILRLQEQANLETRAQLLRSRN